MSHTLSMEDFVTNRVNRLTFGILPTTSFSYSLLSPLLKWRISDLVTFICLALSFIGVWKIKPFEREFMLSDQRLQHHYTEVQQVSNTMLFVYSCVIPFIIIALCGVSLNRRLRIYKTFVPLLGLILSVVTTAVLTDALKNYIGRHRPDFIARCQPLADAPLDVYVLAKDVCTTEDLDKLHDGFRTTPSGHSLISFAGLHYLTLWLMGQFIVGNPLVGTWRVLLSFVPTLGATLIALTRTQDYRHHFVDIVIGALIGIVISWWNYFRLYPWYSSPKSYNPKVYSKIPREELLPIFNATYNPPQDTLIPMTERLVSETHSVYHPDQVYSAG